jgi:hypothetical protein
MDRRPGVAQLRCIRGDEPGSDSSGASAISIVDPDGTYRAGLGCAPVPPGGDAISSGIAVDYVAGTKAAPATECWWATAPRVHPRG